METDFNQLGAGRANRVIVTVALFASDDKFIGKRAVGMGCSLLAAPGGPLTGVADR